MLASNNGTFGTVLGMPHNDQLSRLMGLFSSYMGATRPVRWNAGAGSSKNVLNIVRVVRYPLFWNLEKKMGARYIVYPLS